MKRFSKEVLQFLDCFDGNIYTTVPDNILVYELDGIEYIIPENKINELAKDSLRQNTNLFLYLDKIQLPDNVFV